MSLLTESQLAAIADGLAGPGWVVLKDVGSPELRAALRAEIEQLAESARLQPAGVGQGNVHQLNTEVRRDNIAWLDASQGAAQAYYLAGVEALIADLNRELYLGLRDAEAHFAAYEPGAFYVRHLDRFRTDSARTVSTVYYLNPGWTADDGGCLEIFDPQMPERRIAEIVPEDGVFVCFLSDRIWHAVAATRERTRYSIAGWLRRARQG